MTIRLPIILFALILATLLIGQRFGYTWAGGNGQKQFYAMATTVVGTVTVDHNGTLRSVRQWEGVTRGERISTEEGERVVIRIGFANEIVLDERTDLLIDQMTSDGIILRLIRGRLLIDTHRPDVHDWETSGSVTVKTNRTETTVLYGMLSVVNYDFLETVSVVPINTIASVVTGDQHGLITKTPVDIHETDPITVTDASFNPDEGVAKTFYGWAREQTGALF